MINKLLKFNFLIVAVGLLFSPYCSAMPTDDDLRVLSRLGYFASSPPEPEFSSDGKALYNGGLPAVYVVDPNPAHEPVRIPAPIDLRTAPASATATFLIDYVPNGGTDYWGEPCSTFPAEAQAAFSAAASIWANIIQSPVPITIRACWADFGSSGFLGYSGGCPYRRDFTGAPHANTWYAGSLANSLAGADLDPGSYDMHITYSQHPTWSYYYGTDGNTPTGQIDFMSIALHEIAHGLNFLGSMSYSSGDGSWGGGTGYPIIYDTFMKDGSGNALLNTDIYPNPSTALGTALTSNNIWFHGSNAMAANGGVRVKMYAPSTWSPGASYLHLDNNTFNNTVNELMVYAGIGDGESIHDPGPVTRGLLKDLGWAITTGGCWEYTILDSAGYVGAYTSIALDSDDHVHISYYDMSNGDLRYATNASGSWVANTLDSEGNVGAYTSIALDSDDHVHISYQDYYDIDNSDLKYTTNASGDWEYYTIDSAVGVGLGYYTSIVLDSDDYVHISYWDGTNWALKYATNASGSWVVETPDSEGSVGAYTSIALDSVDAVHISYRDNTNTALKYATNASGSWVPTTIDSTGDTGWTTSIALDTDDHVHISYYDMSNGDLKYATNASGSWVANTLDSEGSVGAYTSIALDTDDHVHISYQDYYDIDNSDLKYATNASGSWVANTLDSEGNVGRDTSIALDTDDHVHISYYDITNSDLKYATNAVCPVTVCVSTTTGLQNALNAAQTNGAHDIIQVVQGTYNDNFTFDSTEGHSITLEGGYTSWCAARVVDPVNTILDGGNADRVLNVNQTNGGDIMIEGLTIQNGDTSSDGGGVHAYTTSSSGSAGNITIANNIVMENNADIFGGGVFAYSSADGPAGAVTITNNLIAGNTAVDQGGGGVYAVSASSISTAGTVTFTNNSIMGNDTPGPSGRGGGIFLYGDDNVINCYNNIVWGNTATSSGDDIHLGGSSGIANGYNNDYSDMSGSWDSEAGDNINADPLFVDVSDPDPVNWDLHLRSYSPCIDAGDNVAPLLPVTDFEGEPRIINGTVDMGADEAAIISVSSTSSTLCPDGLGFGEVETGSSRNLNLVMNNTKDTDIFVIAVTDPSAPFTKTADGCYGVTLHPGDTCSIRVQFAPGSTGTFYDSFLIPTDDPEAGMLTVALSGIGISGTLVETRGSAPSGPGATVIPDVSAEGSEDATLASPPVVVDSTSSTGTASVETSGSSSQIIISSLPLDSFREPGKQLLLAEELEPFDVMVFGKIQVGASDQLRIIFSHEQGAAIHMGDIIIPSDPYVIVEDRCSGNLLGPGGECAVTVQFSPPSAQNFNDYFLIPTNDPEVGILRINLGGMGISE